jgi:hypothetical protein
MSSDEQVKHRVHLSCGACIVFFPILDEILIPIPLLLYTIVMCMVVHATNEMGSSSDDWIY